MQSAIFHLERFEHFLHHVAELNRLYAPDDPVVDAMDQDAAAWDARTAQEGSGEDPVWEQAVEGRRRLHAIHRGFPTTVTLSGQCAYLLRAFVGQKPFPEANARTAWDYTAEMLQHAGHSLEATWDEGRALATSLWLDREADGEADALATHGDDFASLARWFHDRLA